MSVWFQGLVVLFLVWVAARVIKRNTPFLQNFFIPSSLVGGVVLLLIGYQVLSIIPKPISDWLSTLPALLINIVFATMFIGHKRPSPQQIWKQAGPMIAFGNTIAWGMYVIGAVLVLLVLQPVFGVSSGFGSILEVSFSGGHGTVAGLSPTFEKFGWFDLRDVALGLATISIVVAVVAGIIIINVYNRRIGRIVDRMSLESQKKRMIRNGYDLTRFSRRIEASPKKFLIVVAVIAISIALGWAMLAGLIELESITLSSFTDIRVLAYMPLFPVVMFSGLIVSYILEKTNLLRFVDLKMMRSISSIALDLLIITAIGTMSLNSIGRNGIAFILLAVAGVAWVLFAFKVFAPRFFRTHWFEYGLTDIGQALGMTATGLLLNRLADPLNRTGARESFAYKQLAYEPFMGGGVLTVLAVVVIGEFGLLPVLIASLVICVSWIIVGLTLGQKHYRRHRHDRSIASIALR